MIAYYQTKVKENAVSSEMSMLSKLGYTISCVVPRFSQNDTSYIIVYYRK